MDVWDSAYWTGCILGVVGFFGLTSGRAAERWAGSLLSCISLVVLLPWAWHEEQWGLMLLWFPILLSGLRGLHTNKED
jgi:hypothetical protein